MWFRIANRCSTWNMTGDLCIEPVCAAAARTRAGAGAVQSDSGKMILPTPVEGREFGKHAVLLCSTWNIWASQPILTQNYP